MTPGDLAEAVRDELVALAGWGTNPVAVWFPDFASVAAVKELGLTAAVIVPENTRELQTRGGLTTRQQSVHVAVMSPMTTGTWAEGKSVVDKAEACGTALLGVRLEASGLYAVCVLVDGQPVISAEYARQHSLWVSYLKLQFRAG